MRKAIRLKIFQQMPNYKKPASIVLKESFPLPPYSTIIGMVHKACGYTDYHPMKISIQGVHASDVAATEKQYTFGSIPKDRCDIVFENSPNGVRSGMKSIQLLTDVELCIHIVPEDEQDLEHIYNSLMHPAEYLCIGRWEDLARVDDVSIVTLDEITEDNLDDDDFDLYDTYEAYCPVAYLENGVITESNAVNTIYRIPKVFDTKGKNKRREWKEVVPVTHTKVAILNREALLLHEAVYLDRYNEQNPAESYLVILA